MIGATPGRRPRPSPLAGTGVPRSARRPLQQLARLHGVQPGYQGTDGTRRRAGDEVLVATLAAMGVPIERPEGAADALRATVAAAERTVLEPVVVHRGGTVTASVSIPHDLAPASVWVAFIREDGEVERRPLSTTGGRPVAGSDLDGRLRLRHRIRFQGTDVPPGYHRLTVEGPGIEASAVVVSAPPRLPAPARTWGLSIPLYAVRTRGDWGVGSLADLAALASWAGEQGAGLVGTLPLYAGYLDTPGPDPSPYRPVSRLAWNELYVDVEAVPELAMSPEARRDLASAALRQQLARLRRSPLAHPGATLALKRRLLEAGAAVLHGQDPRRSPRRAAFDEWVAAHPDVAAYARFRGARRRAEGRLGADGSEQDEAQYHLYAQWVADTQLAALATGPGESAGLYLDLPVGVHPEGFDPAYEPEAFVPGVSGGAPPDDFFSGGQDWAFPPLHPEGIRRQGYRHLIAVLRTAMGHASALRLDHVMGLHRMYWVPDGADARQGVYVRYHGDELHAVVTLEAHRSGAVVVGEDLGTVPAVVERAMARDRMLSSFVCQFESTADDPLPPPPRRALASFGTHDLPTFAGFWRGLDIGDRRRRDLIDADAAAEEASRRARWRAAVLSALPGSGLSALPADGAAAEERRALLGCLSHLAASEADAIMIDLEDLLQETEPQNRPGTGPEAGNFRRRAARRLEEITADPEIAAALREVDARRRPALGTASMTTHTTHGGGTT